METRCVRFKRGDESSILLQVSEMPSKGLYTWEASLLLAAYLFYTSDRIRDKSVIEIGSGTGLCGLMAAQLGAKGVLMSDRDQPLSIRILQHSIEVNNLTHNCKALPLEWPFFFTTDTPVLIQNTSFDVIIGADVFYSQDTIDLVLTTVGKGTLSSLSCYSHITLFSLLLLSYYDGDGDNDYTH